MKVKEALVNIFGMTLGHPREYVRGKGWQSNTSAPLEITSSNFGDSLACDRKVLESNFDTELSMIDHFGSIGMIGFKMRNGRWAVFMFNSPTEWRKLARVENAEQMAKYKKFKESLSEDHNLASDELELWVTLKSISGKGLK